VVPESVPLFSLGPHRRQCKIRARVLVGPRFGISSLYILYYNLFGVYLLFSRPNGVWASLVILYALH
jgi:hypothetical protein